MSYLLFKRSVLEEVPLVTNDGNNNTDASETSKKMKWRAESFLVAGEFSF